ncbi:MAG: ATP-dependent helicase [Candidatus Magasanikbacteria bacterium]|nr:ATP-dependent helicase [Candidatus Magasanikbacteria bacterium]
MINFQKELNKEQNEAVINGDGYCLVLAGAGSGKTRTITYRVAYLLEKGVKPENILLLTFTNRAAKEMLSRVETLTGKKPEKLWGGTYHSIANRILRHFGEIIGYPANFTVLDADDSKTLMKSGIKDLHLDGSTRFPSVNIIHNLFSFSRNSLMSISDVVESKFPHLLRYEESMKDVCALYQKKKKESNVMDFDDLLSYWLEILNNPDVLKKIAEQFHYVLIDEFQDTNRLQAAIVKKLSSIHNNLLVVGDDAQSIYAFRAADINNILDFPKNFPKAKVHRLVINYRSTPNILDLANDVISQNKKQFPKELQSKLKSAEQPQLITVNNPYTEAEFISQKVVNLAKAGNKLQSIAVLFRAAFHAQMLEIELAKMGIPYEMRGGLKFFERAHIKDVLSLLRLINNGKDEIAWFRVLEIFQGIGHETAKIIIGEARKAKDFSQLFLGGVREKLSKTAQRGWDDFASIAKILDQKRKGNPGEIITELVESVYSDYLKERYENADDRLDDIRQLSFYAKNHKTLNNFLSEIALDESYSKKKDDTRDRLVLSTIHQSKGLEWDSVFLINLANGCFPNERAMKEDGGEEEERRLFYVGITRAKQNLFITYPMTGSKMNYNQLSPFIEEIKEELIEKKIQGGLGEISDEFPTIQIDDDSAPAFLKKNKKIKTRPGEFLRSIEDL